MFINEISQLELECEDQDQLSLKPNQQGHIFETPFIQNLDDKTPLHMCLDDKEKRAADFYLGTLLPDMPLDHHGKAIADCMGDCFKQQLTSIGPYLDKRIVQTKQFANLWRETGKTLYTERAGGSEGLFVSSACLWADINDLKGKIFRESDTESENTVKVLDVPYIHNLARDENKKFTEALSELTDYKIFQRESIRAILNF